MSSVTPDHERGRSKEEMHRNRPTQPSLGNGFEAGQRQSSGSGVGDLLHAEIAVTKRFSRLSAREGSEVRRPDTASHFRPQEVVTALLRQGNVVRWRGPGGTQDASM
ncbi:hypothetical protein V2G26_017586 [Clonostachys chloroleuca]